MTAKSALMHTLEDTSSSLGDMRSAALNVAREHHMGVAALAKLRMDHFGFGTPPLSTDVDTVEAIVRHIADHAFAILHGCHEDDRKENDVISIAVSVPESCGPEIAPALPVQQKETTDASTQASLLPTNQDFQQLFASFKQLRSAFSEFVVESADREQRYNRKVHDLSTKMDSLSSALKTVRQEAKETEQRLTKKVKDLTSRLISDLTHSDVHKKSTTTSSSQATNSKSYIENASCDNPCNESMQPPTSSAWASRATGSSSAKTLLASKTTSSTEANSPSKPPDDSPSDIQLGESTVDDSDVVVGTLARTYASALDQTWQSTTKRKNCSTLQTSDSSRPKQPASTLQPANVSSAGTMTGSSESATLCGASPLKRAVFYIGGLSPESSLDQVTNYCKNRGIRVSSCRFLPSRRFGIKAARLSVAAADAEHNGILNSEFWPAQVGIRRWRFIEQDQTADHQADTDSGSRPASAH